MRRLVYLCFLFCSLLSATEEIFIFRPEGRFHYKRFNYGSYKLYGRTFDEFTIYQNKKRCGKVEKLNKWTRAYGHIQDGKLLSSSYSPLCSLGSFFDYLRDFEVYDAEENLIGFIEGQFKTDGAATFLFYDRQGDIFAEATIDKTYSNMTICDPENKTLFICSKTLDVSFYTSLNYWTIAKTNAISFDMRFFWPFMAFISEIWWQNK